MELPEAEPPDNTSKLPQTIVNWVFDTAGKISQMSTGAVIAAMGLAGGYAYTGKPMWGIVCACGGVLTYCGWIYLEGKPLREVQRRMQISEMERLELEAISSSDLTERQKQLQAQKITPYEPPSATNNQAYQLPQDTTDQENSPPPRRREPSS